MQSGNVLSNPDRWRFPGDTFFVPNRAQMEEMFSQNGHEVLPRDMIKEALDNTVRVADMCNFELELGNPQLPKLKIPTDNVEYNNWRSKKQDKKDESTDYLKYLCIKGLKEKGLTDKEYRERLEYELDIIDTMGYIDYFLVYWDIMNFCREEQIPE